MPLVFQYGSNCDPGRLNAANRLNGDARVVGLAQTLERYGIAFNKFSQGINGAAADLIKSARRGRRIWGVLYEVSKAGLRRLEDVEGLSYRIQYIRLKGHARSVRTFRVRRAKRRSGLSTTSEYVSHIVRGLCAHEAPARYARYVIDVAIQTNRAATDVNDEEIRRIRLLRNRLNGCK